MPVKKHFISRGLQKMLIEEYLQTKLENAGYAGIDMQKTPMGTRITIKTARPGIVIGRRGARVKELTEDIEREFGINVATIDVESVENPELNARIQAERVAFSIEKGENYRRATYTIIRKIMRAGARGVEISIGGKVTSQRARTQVFRAGIISKCGIPAVEGVDKGVAHCVLKSGVLGIRVKIMPESYVLPDSIKLRDVPLEEKKKKKNVVDEFYEEEAEIEEEYDAELEEALSEGEDTLFEDTSDAEESVLLDVEEKEESAEPKDVELEKAEASEKKEDAGEETLLEEASEEEKEEKTKKKKKSSKKKSSRKRKKSSRKKKESKKSEEESKE